VTYAAKIDKAESQIDWAKSAAEIDRHIRAFNPFPGASTTLAGLTVKIWAAAPAVPVGQSGAAGEVLAVNREGILIACGEGAMLVRELQKAGGKRLSAVQFLAGTAIAPGARFCPAT
jgi:methionyl-tRNA formyltransferase